MSPGGNDGGDGGIGDGDDGTHVTHDLDFVPTSLAVSSFTPDDRLDVIVTGAGAAHLFDDINGGGALEPPISLPGAAAQTLLTAIRPGTPIIAWFAYDDVDAVERR